jgi:hypothetical protein
MEEFGFLVLILAVAAVGFLLGQIALNKGYSPFSEVQAWIPADARAAVKTSLIVLGALLGLLFFGNLVEYGPGAVIPTVFGSLWVLSTVWVYLDAKERGVRAKAWAMLTFFTFVFGLCCYLITRPDKPRSCPRCAFKLREDFVVCPYCGPQPGLNCPGCQATLDPSWRFCPYCQAGVDSPGAGPIDRFSSFDDPLNPTSSSSTTPYAPA